jgi:hypothetical protein
MGGVWLWVKIMSFLLGFLFYFQQCISILFISAIWHGSDMPIVFFSASLQATMLAVRVLVLVYMRCRTNPVEVVFILYIEEEALAGSG